MGDGSPAARDIILHPSSFTLILAVLVSPELTSSPLFIAAVIFSVLGVMILIAGLAALAPLRVLTLALRTLFGLLFVALGGLAGGVAFGMQGYRVLTREDLAARIAVQPAGPQRYTATFRFPDGRTASYELAGDEIYVDAHI